MKRLDRFILKSFIGPFFAILGIVIFILVLQFLWLYIDELVGKGLEFKVILEFLMWGSCQVLPLAMPLATLLSSMMTLGQMGEQFELTAIKASGISLTRILMPMIVASVIISIGAFFIGDRLVPYSINQIFTMRDDIGRTKSEIKIPTGTFYDGIEGYILRVESRDKASGMMYNIQVYDHTEGKGNTRITVADSGMIRMSKAKDYLTFQLYDGTNYSEDNKRRYRDTTLALQRVRFRRQELVIPLENYAFHHSDSARYGEQVKSMNLKQLQHGRDSLSGLVDEDIHRHVDEFLHSAGLNFRYQLDSSWKEKKDRLMDLPRADYPWRSLSEERRAYESASTSSRQLQTLVSGQSMDTYGYVHLVYRTDVERWKKYAQALACLLLFFIGAPIGAILKKGGLGTPAIVSLLFFVLYWVVDITGERLASNGATTAFVGKFISAFVLAPIGAVLTASAIKDAAPVNMDLIKAALRKFKSKVIRMFRQTRIVYMGTPEFAVAPLDALIKGGYKVVGVVTAVDKPSGRGLKLSESAVKQYAVAAGIPVLQPEKLKDPAFLEELAALKADLFVVVGFRMLPEVVFTMPRMGTFNLHAALLPQYRGAAPINWAVINGENISGVTTFMIDKNIDTGGIILRSECRVEPTDTAGDLHDKLMTLGADLVVQTVEGLIQHNVELRVQRSFIQGSELLKPAPKLSRELQHIDWRDTTKHVYNLVRGLSPYPCAFTELVGEDGNPQMLKVFFGEQRFDLPKADPGTVLSDGKTYFAIATEDGALAITDLQLAGKKRMDVKSFLLGFRDPASYRTTEGTSRQEMEKAKPVEE